MRNFTRYLKNVVMIIIVGGLMLFPVAASASGPIIYEQSPGHFGGFSSDSDIFTVADEFQFDKPTLVYNITWWGGYMSPGTPLTDDFKILLFADSGGQPGALLQAFAVGNDAMRTPTGGWVNPPEPDFVGCPEFQYYYDFPVSFFAAAGTRYWVSIVNVPSSDSWVWEVSDSLRYLGVQRSWRGAPWAPYFDNTAFRLKGEAVP